MIFKHKTHLAYILFVFFIFGCVSKDSSKIKTPNIIYILADDLGYGDLFNYNQDSKIKTPNLDLLARQGMCFTDMHSTSSVCTPTRYSILTGEYAWRTNLKSGVLWSYGPLMIPDDKETVAKLLKRNNYHTAVIGKWHLGLDWQLKIPYDDSDVDVNHLGFITNYNEKIIDFSKAPSRGPSNTGFDYSYIIPASLDIPPYVYLENEVYTSPVSERTTGSNLDGDYDEDFWRPGPMAEGFEFYEVLPKFIDKAKNYLTDIKEKKTPFFLYLPLAAPHTPWVPKPDYNGSSEAGQYGDFVNMIDDYIGQLLNHLDELGLAEDTMIVFTSDNGPYWKPYHIDNTNHLAAGKLRGMKGDIYDGGHRVPYIIRWPGKIKPGGVNNHPNTLANFYATVANVLGTSSDALDSFSVYHEITDENYNSVPKPIIHHSLNGHFAIRNGDWKMIEKQGSGGFSPSNTVKTPSGVSHQRLYNIQNDLSEQHDRSKEYPQKMATLKRQLDSIRGL